MMAYATRAVPWLRVTLAAALVVILMLLVRWDPWTLWPLQGTAVGLLAGAAAWCFDEEAAAVVDVAPRGMAWRALARGPAVALLLLAWVVSVLYAGDELLFGHRDAVLVQGLVAVAAGTGFALWRRTAGDAVPGLLGATVVVPATTVWALVRPFDNLPIFPYANATSAAWETSVIGWVVLGSGSLAVAILALGEVRWWRVTSGQEATSQALG